MMGLRTSRGLDLRRFGARFGTFPDEAEAGLPDGVFNVVHVALRCNDAVASLVQLDRRMPIFLE